ncbi:MAG TPA: nitrous oxide reductase accessory protein NosL, partial [Chitinophagaceae bacterium]
QPEPFKYGTDECHACKMTIMDPKFGCEIITTKGKLYKFDDAICIARFLTENKLAEKDIKQTLVINFDKQNDFLAVNKAVFVLAQAVKTPMNSHVAAFATKDAAEKFSADKSGAILNWKEVLLKLQ